MTGKYYDDLEVGQVFSHSAGRTVTEMDNILFCALTLNAQPIHVNADFATGTEFGQRLVNGLFTLGLVVGLSVHDLTEGTIVANLGYDKVLHPHPVFHGDTIYAQSEVLSKRDSASRPQAGIVRLKQVGRKQDGTVVVELERTALFLKAASMRARRALLYMPGDSQRKIEKALTLDADSICMDLEDGVAPSQKAAARAVVRQALTALNFARSERLVRINSVGSGLEAADLAETILGHPDGVVLPKVDSASAVRWLDGQLGLVEQAQGWPAGGIAIIAIVETARGILNLAEISAASPRLQALIFGAEDLAADVGATRTRQGAEVLYARSALVTCAAAFGLQAIDMVYVDYQDEAGLTSEARQGAELGYSGKQAIHPRQIEPIQAAFTPSPDAISRAQRIVKAAAENAAGGLGAFAFEGKMVDAPVIRAAEAVLIKARAAGLDA